MAGIYDLKILVGRVRLDFELFLAILLVNFLVCWGVVAALSRTSTGEVSIALGFSGTHPDKLSLFLLIDGDVLYGVAVSETFIRVRLVIWGKSPEVSVASVCINNFKLLNFV